MAKYHDWIIEELETDIDHIHIFLSALPRYSPSQIVKLIKIWTYNHIYDNYPEIKKYLWGGKMWCEGYYISTVLATELPKKKFVVMFVNRKFTENN